MKVAALIDILEGGLSVRDDPHEWIMISPDTANDLLAILHALPRAKGDRPKGWTRSVESDALFGMVYDRPVNELAREIAGMTGQPETSCRRRLREMKKGREFAKLMENRRKGETFHAAREGVQK